MRQKVEYLERTREMLLHACHSESLPIWFMVHGRMNSCLTRVSIREEEQVICSFRKKLIFYGRSDMRRQLAATRYSRAIKPDPPAFVSY